MKRDEDEKRDKDRKSDEEIQKLDVCTTDNPP